ncbi:hypothetical protein GOP47_0004426 [Adiantum capillus-veneris]|uniref:Pentatricopeptide repeat-containing protein n=1 Tax=Adiantum capillus-veneris TaxID=13818 RepID=A0A9D4V8U6_ADICA|nr:hypothetical protein GOP47_0004426 [Adiantum capillus-veneris]
MSKQNVRQWNDGSYAFLRSRVESEQSKSICLVASLKDCANRKDVSEGSKLHAYIRANGSLFKSPFLGNTLVSMYAKCGEFPSAEQVLLQLPTRDVVSWNALIAGLAKNSHGAEALTCYRCMQSEGLSPNDITYACMLKTCSMTQNVDMGKQLHVEIVNRGLLENNVVLGTALVDMYAKCGVLAIAQQTLNELSVRNAATWSTLIGGYTRQGQGKEALNSYEQMRSERVSPDAITYACTLKACGIAGAFQKGKQIHDEIVAQGLLENNVVLGNALVDMYVKCGKLSKAQELLDNLPTHNAVSWNILITGYAQRGLACEALDCYKQMQSEGFCPDAITYACTLKACGIMGAVDLGIDIHKKIVNNLCLGQNIMLGASLIDMYAKCSLLLKAAQVLYELHGRDVVSWNALIAGHVQQGKGKEALQFYEQMKIEGVFPDAITYASVLKACGITQNAHKGKQIHGEIVNQGPLHENVMLGNALVNMYAKCGLLSNAQQLLDKLCTRDVVSWNALIAGFAQNGQGEEALRCYERMQRAGHSPDAITYACILRACSISKEIIRGKRLHQEVINEGLLKANDVLGNALVDMYAKCGVLMKAQEVHEKLSSRDVVSWSALIGGYAQYGHGKEALKCFQKMRKEGLIPNLVCWNALIGGFAKQGHIRKVLGCLQMMQEEGISPDAITFLCILDACSHSGLVDEGQTYFESMWQNFGVTPNIEHYACLMDLFCRAGFADKAISVIKKTDYTPLWAALDGDCDKGRFLLRGKHLVTYYRCMSFAHAWYPLPV